MGVNPNWDEWEPDHLLLDERLSAPGGRFELPFADGYTVAPGVGPFDVDVASGTAIINGYEVANGAETVAVAPSATNYIFVTFVKVPDTDPSAPLGSIEAIVVSLVVNTDGVPPSVDSLLLATVTTDGVGITGISQEDTRRKIHQSQLSTDIETNQFELTNQVLHRGTIFPTVPAPKAGQIFYRTDLFGGFIFDGAVWVPIPSGTFPTSVPGTADVAVASGNVVYISSDGGVSPLIATNIASVPKVLGIAVAGAGIGGPVDVVPDRTVGALFEPFHPLPAAGEKVFLSKLVPGTVKVGPPAGPGPHYDLEIGTVFDTTTWVPGPTPSAAVAVALQNPVFIP